jgi:hypothetical protein
MRVCKKCHKEITKRYNIFCNKSCAVSFILTGKIRTPRNNCKHCGKLIPIPSQKYCNRSCSASVTNTTKARRTLEQRKRMGGIIRKVYQENEELRKQRSINSKRLWKEGKYRRAKIQIAPKPCKICDTIIENSPRVTCSKKCFSLNAQQRGLTTLSTGWGKCGWYRGIRCQSTYELAFVIWALDHGENIKRCKVGVPYEFEGIQKLYNPDFEIDGQIIEIKGYVTKMTEVKNAAAVKLGVSIITIDKEGIVPYLDYVNEKYSCNIQKDYEKFYEEKNST